ncbi:MAG: XTP/dITP diphosphatase [Candidatus Omnitrophica bacterium]|nr:XTP/dITP diphosphatase [Candidatus Omnitrophota bacterium]MDE2008730.1 XTP/dITP diphosphatase [Candidatus Omnitrophota bacterium]MDE2215154.1 XTP/dITP diphosphatase [Candidatus Omnitrophota bacterium]MDE2232157.1 XTP/dITP diphosphatase [Candidatus Omnitrophota bacterium]
MKELIVASRNKGKVKEIIELLSDLPFKVTSLLDYPQIPDIIEDGKTYRENALKKARFVALATGKMAMADDSGIEVAALGNAPGIYSARFAGKGAGDAARNKKLFALLKGVPGSKRQARYRCVIALVDCKAQELGVVQGTCSGYVTTKNIGTNGFGFDPLFLLKRYNKTFGQLPASLKAKISHRARALKKFRILLSRHKRALL